ncbi:MAG: hypothetical protein RLZZ292_3062 [Bacteroidota bacterium]|jgi:putative endopeptidase
MKKIFSLFLFLPLFLAAQQKDVLDYGFMDKTVKPSDDFYRYCMGTWMAQNPVPATESAWGSFNIVAENNKKILRQIMDEAATGVHPKGSALQKIGDFYKSGVDSVSLNKKRAAPLAPYFTRIKALKNKKDLTKMIADYTAKGLGTVYSFYVEQDQEKSSVMIPYIGQSGLSLPDRDYYLKEDADKKRIRQEYSSYMVKMFKLLGDVDKDAAKAAEDVMDIETKLAQISMDRVTQRDPHATYHKMTWKEANALTKNLNWTEQTMMMKLPALKEIIVKQPEFFKGLDKVIADEKIGKWQNYMRWQFLDGFAQYLSDDFSDEYFNFHGKTLSGAKKRKPRAERVMLNVDGNLGELVGQIYVKRAFQPEAKARMLTMVKNLQTVFGERITKLDWMSDETKKRAQEKLGKFLVKIGYPDKWRDYTKFSPTATSFVTNQINMGEFNFRYMVNKLGKPVDKTEWYMSPQTVNAYYNPTNNEIVFPAGILQPPFFNMEADDAIIYGSIGAVIGHEMTHGFDDEGRQYDADGNLKDWWTKDDAARFDAKTAKIVEQFNNYRVLDTIPVNGKLTLGENIADLGGLNIALDAFKRTPQGKSNESIGGMTAEQRFFWSWTNAWKGNATTQRTKNLIMTDPHGPREYRANGPITHMDEWHNAFSIQPSDKMYRKMEDRVKIW